jgi:MFS family permease
MDDPTSDRGARSGTLAPVIETDLSFRLDRLPWGRFQTLVVAALGITWILDGLEVTLVGAVAGALKESPVLHLRDVEIGLASSAYLAGAVVGALLFGWLTDRLGRKKLFFITLALYLTATAATAFSWDFFSFACFRLLTGAGIGGEYTAINSAIQELVPARVRGWSDLAINGSFWLGAALGAGASIVLLDPNVLSPELGWRTAFFIGAALSATILFMRFWIPESPRWLATHGRAREAEAVVAEIEAGFRRTGHTLNPGPFPKLRLRSRTRTPLREAIGVMLGAWRRRTFVGLSLMIAQAFFYNAIFFTYALILTDFYAIPAADVGWYILPFAASNFLGPLLLGHLFDSLGRRPMIAVTYGLSGALLALTGYLFAANLLSAAELTLAWSVIFFFASAAASAAYLTVSETFPLEIRALAIAVFYAIGTGVGGVVAPWAMGALIETGSRQSVCGGYVLGAVLMIAAGAIAARWGEAAERKSLETIAPPLASAGPSVSSGAPGSTSIGLGDRRAERQT